MVAQVLAELQSLERKIVKKSIPISHDFNCELALDRAVLSKMRSYTKPIKTKHLAKRLHVDSPALVLALNRLSRRGLIYWKFPKKRNEDKQYYGWLCA